MIDKLINKGVELFIGFYQDDPFTTICILLTVLIFIVCCIRLFKYLVLAFLGILTVIVLGVCVNSYLETRTLEYQLAQQMIAERCVDTIDLELYLKYENITFVDGKQYKYGQNPPDSVVRNYVCHASKRTYSTDFLLDIYKDRPTLKDHVNELRTDIDMVIKLLNNRNKKEASDHS